MPDFSFLDDKSDDGTIRIRTSNPPPRQTKTQPASNAWSTLLALFVVGGCVYAGITMNKQFEQQYVSAAQMGTEWPLKVPSGYVRAYRNQQITFVSGGKEYGVNGSARGRLAGHEDIESITVPGMGVGELLNIGLKLQKALGKPGG